MLRRCYSEDFKDSCYADKCVCDEWHNFQNFAKWAVKQIGFDRSGWELDKDILIRGNKVYGPTECCFVPKRINSLLIKSGEYKVNGMLSGVRMCKKSGRYIASYRDVDSNKVTFETSDLKMAEEWYRNGKGSVVKALAAIYKDIIDQNVYDALMRWEAAYENPHL